MFSVFTGLPAHWGYFVLVDQLNCERRRLEKKRVLKFFTDVVYLFQCKHIGSFLRNSISYSYCSFIPCFLFLLLLHMSFRMLFHIPERKRPHPAADLKLDGIPALVLLLLLN